MFLCTCRFIPPAGLGQAPPRPLFPGALAVSTYYIHMCVCVCVTVCAHASVCGGGGGGGGRGRDG